MGFYLRKSVSLGPLRFNLSKSGIGVSAGMRGLRIGAGPRGNYVHMGRHGVYYRATLPSGRLPRIPEIPARSSPASVENMQPIESGSATKMVDTSSADLLAEINRKHRLWPTWPFVAFVCLVVPLPLLVQPRAAAFDIVTLAGISLFFLSPLFVFLAVRHDFLRRTSERTQLSVISGRSKH